MMELIKLMISLEKEKKRAGDDFRVEGLEV